MITEERVAECVCVMEVNFLHDGLCVCVFGGGLPPNTGRQTRGVS